MKDALILILSLVAVEPSIFTNQTQQKGDRQFANIDESPAFVLGPQQEAKTKIKKEELPEAARKTLEGDAFKGWTVAQAYKLSSGDFEVELKRDKVTQILKFDKEGKLKNEQPTNGND